MREDHLHGRFPGIFEVVREERGISVADEIFDPPQEGHDYFFSLAGCQYPANRHAFDRVESE